MLPVRKVLPQIVVNFLIYYLRGHFQLVKTLHILNLFKIDCLRMSSDLVDNPENPCEGEDVIFDPKNLTIF